ncbi:MAG: DUF4435 domain-containing protein [Bacteroidales bacterium]|nr:DUF4435 domain-containing protein [Bacteroidales bacterium]
MAKKLTENVSSLYIEASNNLRPKTARRRIVAYVESYDDVSFWSHLLSEYNTDKYYFQVMLPSKTSLAKGKKVAMMNELGQGLGQHMIACVDSDYDYLIQGMTATSKRIIHSPYVLHTYAYAIENYQCYAESLHGVCVQSTLNDRAMIDFAAFFGLYSRIIYPLFVWNIWFYRKHILSVFSMQDFCRVVRLDPISVQHPEDALEQLRVRVEKKIHWLSRRYPAAIDELERMKDEFAGLGVSPENTYMYIQGHHLKEQVVLKLLTPVCVRLRRERELEIRNLACHAQQYRNELTAYHHSLQSVESVLRKNTNYEDAPTYKMIQRDVERLLKLL